MAKTSNRKAKAEKALPTLDIKKTVEEVELSCIALPEENPARADCSSATIEKYRGLIEEHIAALRKHERSGSSEPKPSFPFARPKVKRIESNEDGCDLEVIGGCHTLMAATEAGLEWIEVEICEGSDEDLLVLAIQDNANHGLAYNRQDLRQNIRHLRKLNSRMSYDQIGAIVGCSKSHVGNVLNGKDEETSEESTAARKESKPFDRKNFVNGIVRQIEKNLNDLSDVDMFELAKASGRILRLLDEKNSDLLDFYREALEAVVNPETYDLVDYEGDMLWISDEKRKEIEAQRRIAEAEHEAADEPEAEE